MPPAHNNDSSNASANATSNDCNSPSVSDSSRTSTSTSDSGEQYTHGLGASETPTAARYSDFGTASASNSHCDSASASNVIDGNCRIHHSPENRNP